MNTAEQTATPRRDALKEATRIASEHGFEAFDPAAFSHGTKGHEGTCSRRRCGQEAFFQRTARPNNYAYCWEHMTDSVWNGSRYPERRVEGAYDRLLELWDQYENGVIA